MARRLAHISLFKRRDAAGLHNGGVEQLGEYLHRALPALELFSWADFPMWQRYSDRQDYQKAEMLNEWLLDSGLLDNSSTVITDGYWGTGLEGKVGSLISVVHGSYFGRFLQAQISPWGEIVGGDHIEAQIEHWKHPQVEIVCVSKESAIELAKAGIEKDVEIIYHGVDLDVYSPSHDGVVLMHGATSTRKGLDILQAINQIDESISIVPMNEFSGIPEEKANRLNDAIAFIAPTRHEGNAYMLLEALACGIPLIAYETGLACEMDERCGLFTDDISPQNFIRLIHRFRQDPDLFSPREWAEENCSYEKFAGDWRSYLS